MANKFNTHSGMGEDGRKRFISGSFLALEGCTMFKEKRLTPG